LDVVTVLETPVARLVIVTLAPRSTASDGSRTTPVSVARSTCALAAPATNTSANAIMVTR
jgi:hypothetical protein